MLMKIYFLSNKKALPQSDKAFYSPTFHYFMKNSNLRKNRDVRQEKTYVTLDQAFFD